MTTALFTPEDLDKIKHTIKSKHIRGMVIFSLGSLAFCFLLPFMPGKYTHLSPYQEGTYWHAFVFYLIVFSAMMMMIYYRYIMSINQDIRDGEKIVAQLPVKIKSTLAFGSKFTLSFDKGRLLYSPRIVLPKTEIDNWQVGELVDLELFYKSGEILSYKKVNQ